MRNTMLSVVVAVGLCGGPIKADVAPSSDEPEIFEGDSSPSDIEPSDIDEESCTGDLDGNGIIDGKDLASMLSGYGRCRGCDEDLNEDGYVNEGDVDILLRGWGKCPEEVQGEEEEPADLYRGFAATGGDEIEQDIPEQNEPEEVEPKCPGDLDGNGRVDSTDLALILRHYGRCNGCLADLSGDGYVDRDDVDLLMASWGKCIEATPDDVVSEGQDQYRRGGRG